MSNSNPQEPTGTSGASAGSQPPPPPPPPTTPEPPPPQPSGRPRRGKRPRGKRMLVGVLAAVIVVLVPGAVFAWRALDGGGPQPHDVLPADAVGYVRLDLDPSASQKVNAFRLLDRFPALDTGGLSDDVDLREWVIDEFAAGSGCDIEYGTDVEPWVGDRVGAAILPPTEAGVDPEILVAIQVNDEDAARNTVADIINCGGAQDSGYTYLDGYLIVARNQDIVDRYTTAAQESALSDNEEFSEAMAKLGDPGIASLWFSGAGLMETFEPNMNDALQQSASGQLASDDDPSNDPSMDPGTSPNDMLELFDDNFRSVAMTVRFDSAYAEVAAVVLGDIYQELDGTGVHANVPDTTAAFVGFGSGGRYLNENWELLSDMSPEEMTMLEGMATAAGLTMPDDLATVLGDNFVLALDGRNLDVAALIESEDFSSLQAGLKVTTDADAFADVWEQIRLLAEGGETPVDDVPLQITDDGYVIASSDDYATRLLEDESLAESETFRAAVADADNTDAVYFINFDLVEDAVVDVLANRGLSEEELESLRALRALGYSANVEDGHMDITMRLTTG